MSQTRLSLVGAAGVLLLIAGPGCGDDDRMSGLIDAGPTDAATHDAATDDAGDMDAGDTMDAGTDAGDEEDGGTDAGSDAGNPVSDMIQAVRESADGTGLDLAVTGALVTYVKPVLGDDPGGFFVQASTTGPALFIAIDPSTLSDPPSVGDQVTFTVTDLETLNQQQRVTGLTGWGVVTSGNDISGLVQDVSSATDLVSDLDSYESELITVDATITAAFGGAGTGHVAATIDTDGITGEGDLRLRIPETLRDDLELVETCEVTVTAPLWRFNDVAQASAWDAADLVVVSCPAPQVVSAMATAQTEMVVTFDRELAAGSLVAGGTQFTFSDGLTATAASLTDLSEVTVTTETQDPDTLYTVTVADSLTDNVGTGIDASANTATFVGFPIPLGVAGVDYRVIAHGARLVISGNAYTDVTTVTIGGVGQTFTVDSDSQITVTALDETTPIGAQNIVISDGTDTGPAFGVTVIHLVINEVDADQAGTDSAEFIEVATGVAAVSLAGYSVVLFNGVDDQSYLPVVELDATTNSNGRLLIAPVGFTPTPDLTFPGATDQVQNGPDAVTIFQGVPADFPNDTAITTDRLIDAVVYGTGDEDDAELLLGFLGTGAEAVQVDEDAASASETQSIQRCGPNRLDGREWQVADPTPASNNTCS